MPAIVSRISVAECGYRWGFLERAAPRSRPVPDEDEAIARFQKEVDATLDQALNAERDLVGEHLQRAGKHGTYGWKEYDPLTTNRSLFLEFARLPKERDAILGFCNVYGDPFGFQQAFDMDCRAIEQMAEVVALLGLLRGSVSQLRRHLLAKYEGKARFMANQPVQGKPRSSFMRTFRLQDFPSEQVAARQLLNHFVRERISSIALQIDPGWEAEGDLSFNVVVKELRHVLWLQFAQAISEGRQYRDCEHCGKPFELAPGENRADKQFCSDTCRAKHNYHSRKKALAMKAKNKSIEQIVKAVGYDAAIVHKWLKPKKGK